MNEYLTSATFWPELLKQISHEVLADPAFNGINLSEFVSAEQRNAGWLGAKGASEEDLDELEHRLGTVLPPSYRAFLMASNGFGPIGYFIWKLRPSTEVDWLVNSDKELIEMWEESAESGPPISDEEYFQPENMQDAAYMRTEYLRGCLMISDWGDAGFLALNPAAQHGGEWEAWHFANWHPGAVRYRSFAELMQAALEDYQTLKNEE